MKRFRKIAKVKNNISTKGLMLYQLEEGNVFVYLYKNEYFNGCHRDLHFDSVEDAAYLFKALNVKDEDWVLVGDPKNGYRSDWLEPDYLNEEMLKKNIGKEILIQKSNQWLKNIYERMLKVSEMAEFQIVLDYTLVEYKYSYTVITSLEHEKDLPLEKQSIMIGTGRLMINKSGQYIQFEGSAPYIDFHRRFEMRMQGIQEYYCLEIPFEKKFVGRLKTIFECTTPELLQMVKDTKIALKVFSHYFFDRNSHLHDLAERINGKGIPCEVHKRIQKIFEVNE